jgi:PAS domain S-box-containing protein
MNQATHSEARPWTPSRWNRQAWLPIPLLLAAIIAARMAGPQGSYESYALLLVLSFTFYTLVSLGTLYLIGRSFLELGSPGLLLLECGVVLWSLAGAVGDFVSRGDANINVTIFNTVILLAGLCHLAGTILMLKPQRVLRAKPLWLMAGCAFALGALWWVSYAALMGWLPVFFIPGRGGTPVRYLVLISAIVMFVLSAGLLKVSQRGAPLPFTSWYALALLLLSVGLFGVMIQLSLGSVVNWLSRTAQWLGGIYLLIAAFASLRESQLPLLPLPKQSKPAHYQDAVAAAMVLATAAIRLTFLSALGMQAPFVTFFPAVTFAAIYGGLRAGLLATALSAVIVDYFWISPAGLAIGQPSDWLAMMTFLLSGAMIAGVSDAMHRARSSATAAEKQALLANERAAAAEALQESRAKLEAALLSMTDAVSISDAQGRFIHFNDAFATFHKFRNREECAKTIAEYPDILEVSMPNGTPAPLDQWAVPRALRGETATNAEYTLRRKDTGETWVGSYSFGPIRNQEGVIVGSVVTARDITERKRIDVSLAEHSAKLEVLNKELESFTYSVSHDLRAPLRAIDGYSRMILKQQGDQFNENTTRLFDVIRSNTKKMGQLIDDLLALSRMGREALSLSRLNMENLTRDVWEELKAINPGRSINLKIDNLPSGMGDRSFINQVLANILSNAVKFTRVREIALIEVGGYEEEKESIYYVRDNGVGFDMQYHDKLFGVFQRLHSADEYEGTGIGMALVQRIILRHGGRVWAESEKDKGATFYFSLPANSGSSF